MTISALKATNFLLSQYSLPKLTISNFEKFELEKCQFRNFWFTRHETSLEPKQIRHIRGQQNWLWKSVWNENWPLYISKWNEWSIGGALWPWPTSVRSELPMYERNKFETFKALGPEILHIPYLGSRLTICDGTVKEHLGNWLYNSSREFIQLLRVLPHGLGSKHSL